MVSLEIVSQLKITNVPWNDSLSNPSSESFIEMKGQLDMDLDTAFCNKPNTISCHAEVLSFSEGSINVLFEIMNTIEENYMLPNQSAILADMQESIISVGIGTFTVNETSLMIGKKNSRKLLLHCTES